MVLLTVLVASALVRLVVPARTDETEVPRIDEPARGEPDVSAR